MTLMMNHKHTIIVKWSEEDKLYLVNFPDFPWQEFVTHGSTYREADQNGQEALDGLMEVFQANDRPLPEPKSLLDCLASYRSIDNAQSFPS